MKNNNWKKYIFEFLSIFIAVISAFALNNWNDNRRDRLAEDSILVEIFNGFGKDLEDIKVNIGGHREGTDACLFWRRIINEEPFGQDSLGQYYLALTRDFTSIQNKSGYESLKSNGLGIILDDSLRFEIISIYESDYYTLKTLEENYSESQFHSSYFAPINEIIAPHLIYDARGNIKGVKQPFDLSNHERQMLLSYLWKIQLNRRYTMFFYNGIEKKVLQLKAKILKKIED